MKTTNNENKHGPKEGLTGSLRHLMDNRGDPDIGRIKRGRVPAGILKANRLAGNREPECEKVSNSEWRMSILFVCEAPDSIRMPMINKE